MGGVLLTQRRFSPRLALKWRLILLLVVAFGTTFSIILTSMRDNVRALEKAERLHVQLMTGDAGYAYRKALGAVVGIVSDVTPRYLTKSGPKACRLASQRLVRSRVAILNVGVVEGDGKILCSALSSTVNWPNVRGQPLFRRFMHGSKSVVSGLIHGPLSHRPVLVVLRKFPARDSTTSVLFAAISVDSLAHTLPNTSRSDEFLTLLDSNGNALVTRPNTNPVIEQGRPPPKLWHRMRNTRDINVHTMRVGQRLAAYMVVAHGLGYVLFTIGRSTLYQPAWDTFWRNLLTAAALLLITVALAWRFLIVSVIRKTRVLQRCAEAVGSGDFTVRSGMSATGDELDRVGHTFDNMAVQLAMRTRQSKLQVLEIAHLNRLYRVVTDVSRMVLRAQDRETIFDEACRIAVNEGEFELGWVGEIDREQDRILGVAAFGSNLYPYFRGNRRLTDLLPDADRLVRTVIRNGRTAVTDTLRVPPPRDHSQIAGAAFPLHIGDNARYVFCVFTTNNKSHFLKHIKLLEQVAVDISYGLRVLDAEHKLHYLAAHDPLTKLLNREAFIASLDRALAQPSTEQGVSAVLDIIVLNFQHILGSTNNETAETLLKRLAQELCELINPSELVARTTTAGFSCAFVDVRSSDALRFQVERLLSHLAKEFIVCNEPLYPRLRMGVAVRSSRTESAEQLLQYAREAANTARNDSVVFFSKEIHNEVQETHRLEKSLRQALVSEGLEVYYQPVVDSYTGKIVGFEALARWTDGLHGKRIPPNRFVPIAERAGLIEALDDWVLRTSVQQATKWSEAGFRNLQISVNVSTVQFSRAGFVDDLIGKLRRLHALSLSNHIALEVTESSLIYDQHRVRSQLARLADFGVSLYLDDFGTGYSSLSYLHTLPFQVLKIDKEFTKNYAKSTKSKAIVDTIISFARSLNLCIIAEGVETEEHLNTMRDAGCDRVQGYLTGRPMPASEATSLLDRELRRDLLP